MHLGATRTGDTRPGESVSPSSFTLLAAKLKSVTSSVRAKLPGGVSNFIKMNKILILILIRRSKKLLSSMPIIGNLEVLLPCQFTGGQLTVSHPSLPGSLRRVNCDETNSNILVISSGSYAGMRHSFDVVHTGYRVSLVYALKSTTTRSVRGHLDFFFAIDIIRDTLSEWKKTRYQPNVIPIQLRNKYAPSSHIHSGSLRDPDNLLFSCLNPVAQELGLRLFVAHTELVERSTWSLRVNGDMHTDWCALNHDHEDDSPSDTEEPCTCRDTEEHVLAFLDQFAAENAGHDFDDIQGPKLTIKKVFEVGGIDGAVLSSGPALSLPGVKFGTRDVIRDVQFGMDEDEMEASNEQHGRGPADKRQFRALVVSLAVCQRADLPIVIVE